MVRSALRISLTRQPPAGISGIRVRRLQRCDGCRPPWITRFGASTIIRWGGASLPPITATSTTESYALISILLVAPGKTARCAHRILMALSLSFQNTCSVQIFPNFCVRMGLGAWAAERVWTPAHIEPPGLGTLLSRVAGKRGRDVSEIEACAELALRRTLASE